MLKLRKQFLCAAAIGGLIAGAAHAQVQSVTYDQNRVFFGSYYNGAQAANPGADQYFFRNRYQTPDQRRQEGYDPEQIQLGAFVARPVLEVEAGHVSNLFLSDGNETSDTYVEIEPRVTARTTWSTHMLGADAIVRHTEFFDTSDESATEYGVRGFGVLDVTSEFALGGSVGQRQSREARTAIGSAVNTAERVEFEKSGAEVNATYEAGRVRLRGRVSTETFDFEDVELIGGGTADQDFRDYDQNRVAASAEYAVNRDWSVIGEVEQISRDYDPPAVGQVNRDIEGYVVRAGTSFELQSNVRGQVTAGFQSFEPDDPTLDTIDGLALNGNVQWFPTELTVLSLNATRDVADAGSVNDASAVLTRFGVGIDHELRRNLILRGNITQEKREFEPSGREDDQTSFRVAGLWKLNRNVHLETGYQFVTRDSDVQPFDDNRLTARLRFFP